MIKLFIEKYIQKTKNRNFRFDEDVSATVILTLFFQKVLSFLRSVKFSFFRKRGNILFFGRNVHLFNKKNMQLGNNTNIGDYVRLSALGKGQLILGNNVNIGSFSQLIISSSFNNLGRFIKIENNVGIGEFAYIGGGGGITIGNDTIIGQYFSVHPENHNFSDNSLLIREQGVTREGISIGENCWVGSKVTILDGVIIGNKCVIAAGSVVTKSFPNNSMIGGVPAKLLRGI